MLIIGRIIEANLVPDDVLVEGRKKGNQVARKSGSGKHFHRCDGQTRHAKETKKGFPFSRCWSKVTFYPLNGKSLRLQVKVDDAKAPLTLGQTNGTAGN